MDKKYTYILAAVIIILLIIAGYFVANRGTNNNLNQQNSTASSPTQTSAPTPSPTTATKVNQVPGKRLSYSEAVKTYPYRFQFNKCQGTPAFLSVKKNSVVMLDNRDSAAHTIKANGQSYAITGYDYALLRVYTEVTDGSVKCDGKNSVTLNVEK